MSTASDVALVLSAAVASDGERLAAVVVLVVFVGVVAGTAWFRWGRRRRP
ncbi:MAG TPA: hypothetical protein VEA78_13950 [Acidimicrobiales bacterium]|nr:hypothetical protein [Acidimicrobiales bacterium]